MSVEGLYLLFSRVVQEEELVIQLYILESHEVSYGRGVMRDDVQIAFLQNYALLIVYNGNRELFVLVLNEELRADLLQVVLEARNYKAFYGMLVQLFAIVAQRFKHLQ